MYNGLHFSLFLVKAHVASEKNFAVVKNKDLNIKRFSIIQKNVWIFFRLNNAILNTVLSTIVCTVPVNDQVFSIRY